MNGDPYLDSNGILKNRLGLEDQEKLSLVESDFAADAYENIAAGEGPARTFDRTHLKAIHERLFGDVYEWAGSMRDERPIVDGERLGEVGHLSKGGSRFLHASRIDMGLSEAFEHISDRDLLRNGSRDDFIQRAGKTLGELNYVHPFREGNGRTQRAFIEELGRETGHDVNFRGITRERMISASIEVHQDPSSDAMRHVLRDAVEPARIEALLQVQDMLRQANIDPQERYVVSARDGEEIEGTVAWQGRKQAHIVSRDGDRLIVVKASDLPSREEGARDVSFRASAFSPEGQTGRASVRSEESRSPFSKPLSAEVSSRRRLDREQKRLVIVSGPNGAGKSTLTDEMIGTSNLPRLDPDLIARGINPHNPEAASLAAGRKTLSAVEEHIRRGESFVQETTLSGSQPLRTAEKAKRAGFRVEQYFVGLDSSEFSKQRVAQRVSRGGHHIPDDVIDRRFPKTFENAVKLAQIADKSRFYDNASQTPHKLVLAREGREMSLAKDAPPWAREVHERLIRLDRDVSRREAAQTRFKIPDRKSSGIER